LRDGRSVPVADTNGTAAFGRFSPDGRWLLYTLDLAGRRDVLVRPVPPEAGGPAGTGKFQIGRGGEATWRADGKEIFYLSAEGSVMAVPVKSTDDSFQAGTAQELFKARRASSFDVTADGQRFLVNEPVDDASDTPVTVIVNWPQLLKK
jgi:Tol biopolymer transport system component